MKLLSLLAFIIATSSATALLPHLLPSLRPLFTATANLGPPLTNLPIPTLGGLRQLQPITTGTIHGAFNATIQSGLAYPILYANRTIEVPAIIVYGTTDDAQPYLIQLDGVGKVTGQGTRVQIEIGGKYTALSNSFVIAEIIPNAARTTVLIDGYEVTR